MLRLLLLLLLVWLIWLWLRGPRLRQRREQDLHQGQELVQDPQCGTYVAKDKALRRNIGGHQWYFCSRDCYQAFRQRWKQGHEEDKV